MDWLTLHAESYGADADRVFLLGQSAGATHALSYLFDPVIDPRHRDRVQAAALMSGTYLMDDKAGPGARAYFGEDADLWDERSPGRHVTASHLPLLLSIAEYDTAVTVEKTLDFASLLKRFGPPPRVERLADCNHVSTLYGLGLGTDVVGKTLRRFFS